MQIIETWLLVLRRQKQISLSRETVRGQVETTLSGPTKNKLGSSGDYVRRFASSFRIYFVMKLVMG